MAASGHWQDQRARDSDAHQRVDVEIAVADREPALSIGRESAGGDCGDRENRDHPGRSAEPASGLGAPQQAGKRQRPPRFRARAGGGGARDFRIGG